MPMERSPRAFAIPAIALLACLAALLIGGALTRPNLDWYATLQKPGFTPPNGIFPVVWPILYLLQAVAVWVLWRAPGSDDDKRPAYIAFFVQLAVGVLWSAAFFAMHSPGAGLAVIMAFLVAIVIAIVLFDRFSRPASLLLVPLLLWVCFATGLNFAIWFLNSSGFVQPQ
jgi:translocator protein